MIRTSPLFDKFCVVHQALAAYHAEEARTATSIVRLLKNDWQVDFYEAELARADYHQKRAAQHSADALRLLTSITEGDL